MSIYVEIRICGTIDDLWQWTQDPALHERWDLRFSKIDYLPRPHEDAPQRFRYTTRLGFGLRIDGEGASTGSRAGADGERTSALRFWSHNRLSLIREGSGYWRYLPASDNAVRFITWYSYQTRFGCVGRAFDAALFRPLMGWATAWSFDRLRLWIERGIDPAVSMQRSLVHAVARVAIAIIFLYQGVVPKLLAQHPSELALLTAVGLAPGAAHATLVTLGLAELALGVSMLIAWRVRWLFVLTLALMPAALIGVAISSPHALVAAFNPVALNTTVAALALVGWITSTDIPSATRCLRKRPPA